MTAPTPVDPVDHDIAKIPTDDAAEDAVIGIAKLAMKMARHIGTPTRDPVAAIYDQRVNRQARRLLLSAAMRIYGVRNFTVRRIIGSLSSIDLASADDHETQAECWERIEDTARDMARQCREYVGDAE